MRMYVEKVWKCTNQIHYHSFHTERETDGQGGGLLWSKLCSPRKGDCHVYPSLGVLCFSTPFLILMSWSWQHCHYLNTRRKTDLNTFGPETQPVTTRLGSFCFQPILLLAQFEKYAEIGSTIQKSRLPVPLVRKYCAWVYMKERVACVSTCDLRTVCFHPNRFLCPGFAQRHCRLPFLLQVYEVLEQMRYFSS